jgi:hypothetical protein
VKTHVKKVKKATNESNKALNNESNSAIVNEQNNVSSNELNDVVTNDSNKAIANESNNVPMIRIVEMVKRKHPSIQKIEGEESLREFEAKVETNKLEILRRTKKDLSK